MLAFAFKACPSWALLSPMLVEYHCPSYSGLLLVLKGPRSLLFRSLLLLFLLPGVLTTLTPPDSQTSPTSFSAAFRSLHKSQFLRELSFSLPISIKFPLCLFSQLPVHSLHIFVTICKYLFLELINIPPLLETVRSMRTGPIVVISHYVAQCLACRRCSINLC